MDTDKTVNSDENKKSFSKPSELNNSFVKKVTSRVSELFPSTFSKWLSPGSSATVRRRESESDDDEDNFNSIQPPPLKRQRLPEEIDIGPSCSKAFSDDSHIYRDGQVAGPSGLRSVQSRLMSSTPIGRQIRSQSVNLYDNKSIHSKHLNGDIKNDNSESTSGCSSMAQMVISKLEDSDAPKTANTSFSSKMNKEKNIIEEISKKELNRSSRSLFMEHNLSPRLQTSQSRRPSFNASSFGSPGLIDRTLTSERIARSPFYRGSTMFGGAASAGNKKRRTGVSPHNVSIPIRNPVEIKPTNETSENSTVGMSQTARRILDALQSFSTPVSDAKKIPKPNLSQRRQLNNKSIRLSAPSTPYSRERTPRSQTKDVSGIVIPTIPDIMQIRQKERIQNSTVQVRQLATTSTSSLNAETEYKIRMVDDDSKAVKHTNKMKTRVSRKDNQDTANEKAEEVKLPNVTLSITSLPKFDQPVLVPPPIATSVNIVPTVTFAPVTTPISTALSCAATTPTLATTKVVSSQSNNYKFSAPIILNKTVTKSIMSINNFKFSTPLKVDNTSKISNSPSSANTPLINFNAPSSTGTVLKKKIISKNNGENIGFLNFTPPKELKRNSVMDVLGKKPEQETKSDDLFEKFKPTPGMWECDSCLIRNKPQDVRCAACEAPKLTATTTTNATGFGLQFEMPADKWECTVCLVRNDSTEQKCVACTTQKSKTKSDMNTKTNFSTSVSGFGDKFKPSSDTWECTTCLIRNKADKDKCVACETAKPGNVVKKNPLNQTSTLGSSQSVEKSSKKWECSVCMVWNTADKSKCVCCAANKPGSNNLLTSYSPGKSDAPTFKFGIDKATENENKTTQPNTGFVFGTSSTETKTEKTNADGFVFGKQPTDTKNSENKEDPKPASGFVFGKPTTEMKTDNFNFGIKPSANSSSCADSKPTFSFGIPSTSNNNTQANHKFTVSDTPVKLLVEKNVKPSESSTEKSELIITNINTSTNSVNKLTSPILSPELMFKFTPTTTINENILKPPAPTVATTANLFSFGTPKTTISNFSTTPATVNMTTTVSTSPLFGTNNASTMGKLSFVSVTKPAPVDSEPEPSAKKSLITNMFPTNAPAINSSKDTLDSSLKFTNLKSTVPNMTLPSFNFSTKADMSTFGTASKLEGMPAFGSIPINQPQNSNPGFIQTQEGFAFGAAKNETKPTSLFTFGTNKTVETEQKKASGFSFPSKPVSTAPPAYNFGNSLNSSTNQNTGFSFVSTQSTEKFNFNASKPESGPFGINAPTEIPFGSKKKESTAFGAPSNTTSLFSTNEQASAKPSFSATNAPNASFNFGSSTQQNSPFSFGNNQSNNPTASSSGGFSFGQPSTFDPNTKPSFNFSGGAGVPSFTAQPAPGPATPQRRIKKALRRTAQPR